MNEPCPHGCHVPTADEIRATIDEYGVKIIGVPGESIEKSSFTYTIGLLGPHGFELLCVGIPPFYAAMIFNDITAKLAAGEHLVLDQPDARWANLPVVFKMCERAKSNDYVYQATYFHEREVDVVQMVLCDKAGKFPWDAGYDAKRMSPQKLLY